MKKKLCFLLLYIAPITAAPKLPNFDIWSDNNGVSPDVDASRLPKVLNFFPVPVEEECLSDDRRRRGICMNAYECKIEGGTSHGACALGFGVCCVFTATCNEEIHNNITYFVNPHFPDLSKDMDSCSLTVKKIDPEISQFRLDFIHFNLGQPNRKTGVCEDDVFVLIGGRRQLKLCGLNSGQHVYFDVENLDSVARIEMKLGKKAVTRLWEVRVTQIPFTQRAPVGCLQYHTGTTGTVKTMNFAENGRHLADQDYNICIRQEQEMCSIVYEPCHENAFRISPNNDEDVIEDVGSGEAPESRADECSDKVVLPCDSEDLLMPQAVGPGFCTLVHCGESLCPAGENPCRIESSITPFVIGVHFGSSVGESPPDDNLGMCLNYEQMPCNV
ncbi:uncharacterized protein LOC123003909 [Tribolium madens]|uniref:uncharacterized protein LOC123003909 n=1 Tax=Tribolium madens TaxID=41895 RepID=UPI001CF7522A|nr:uncharacterized protein LOC123003909 [Tribolium madens]